MGFDLNLFVHQVDEELICSICSEVLENPLQVMPCEHFYCGYCLSKWFKEAPKMTCPVDGREVDPANISAIPRCVQNMLGKLLVKCEKCEDVMCLNRFTNHNCFQDILGKMNGFIEQLDEAWIQMNKKSKKIPYN